MLNKERKQRSFFGKMIVFILAVLAVIGVIAMALSIANAYVNPREFVWTTV